MDKPMLGRDEIRDEAVAWPITRREELADCRVFQLWRDTVVAPGGEQMVRGYLHHPGAVAVIALDEDGRIPVVRQYRHPVGQQLVEAPAGLLDVAGEPAVAAARRELAEEAQLQADDWRVLLDHCCSAGSSQETMRIFLARGLAPAPRPDGFVVADEEAHMDLRWVAVDDLVDAFLSGRVHNGILAAGVLALHAALAGGRVDELRPADAPWPARDAKAVIDGQQPR